MAEGIDLLEQQLAIAKIKADLAEKLPATLELLYDNRDKEESQGDSAESTARQLESILGPKPSQKDGTQQEIDLTASLSSSGDAQLNYVKFRYAQFFFSNLLGRDIYYEFKATGGPNKGESGVFFELSDERQEGAAMRAVLKKWNGRDIVVGRNLLERIGRPTVISSVLPVKVDLSVIQGMLPYFHNIILQECAQIICRAYAYSLKGFSSPERDPVTGPPDLRVSSLYHNVWEEVDKTKVTRTDSYDILRVVGRAVHSYIHWVCPPCLFAQSSTMEYIGNSMVSVLAVPRLGSYSQNLVETLSRMKPCGWVQIKSDDASENGKVLLSTNLIARWALENIENNFKVMKDKPKTEIPRAAYRQERGKWVRETMLDISYTLPEELKNQPPVSKLTDINEGDAEEDLKKILSCDDDLVKMRQITGFEPIDLADFSRKTYRELFLADMKDTTKIGVQIRDTNPSVALLTILQQKIQSIELTGGLLSKHGTSLAAAYRQLASTLGSVMSILHPMEFSEIRSSCVTCYETISSLAKRYELELKRIMPEDRNPEQKAMLRSLPNFISLIKNMTLLISTANLGSTNLIHKRTQRLKGLVAEFFLSMAYRVPWEIEDLKPSMGDILKKQDVDLSKFKMVSECLKFTPDSHIIVDRGDKGWAMTFYEFSWWRNQKSKIDADTDKWKDFVTLSEQLGMHVTLVVKSLTSEWKDWHEVKGPMSRETFDLFMSMKEAVSSVFQSLRVLAPIDTSEEVMLLQASNTQKFAYAPRSLEMIEEHSEMMNMVDSVTQGLRPEDIELIKHSFNGTGPFETVEGPSLSPMQQELETLAMEYVSRAFDHKITGLPKPEPGPMTPSVIPDIEICSQSTYQDLKDKIISEHNKQPIYQAGTDSYCQIPFGISPRRQESFQVAAKRGGILGFVRSLKTASAVVKLEKAENMDLGRNYKRTIAEMISFEVILSGRNFSVDTNNRCSSMLKKSREELRECLIKQRAEGSTTFDRFINYVTDWTVMGSRSLLKFCMQLYAALAEFPDEIQKESKDGALCQKIAGGEGKVKFGKLRESKVGQAGLSARAYRAELKNKELEALLVAAVSDDPMDKAAFRLAEKSRKENETDKEAITPGLWEIIREHCPDSTIELDHIKRMSEGKVFRILQESGPFSVDLELLKLAANSFMSSKIKDKNLTIFEFCVLFAYSSCAGQFFCLHNAKNISRGEGVSDNFDAKSKAQFVGFCQSPPFDSGFLRASIEPSRLKIRLDKALGMNAIMDAVLKEINPLWDTSKDNTEDAEADRIEATISKSRKWRQIRHLARELKKTEEGTPENEELKRLISERRGGARIVNTNQDGLDRFLELLKSNCERRDIPANFLNSEIRNNLLDMGSEQYKHAMADNSKFIEEAAKRTGFWYALLMRDIGNLFLEAQAKSSTRGNIFIGMLPNFNYTLVVTIPTRGNASKNSSAVLVSDSGEAFKVRTSANGKVHGPDPSISFRFTMSGRLARLYKDLPALLLTTCKLCMETEALCHDSTRTGEIIDSFYSTFLVISARCKRSVNEAMQSVRYLVMGMLSDVLPLTELAKKLVFITRSTVDDHFRRLMLGMIEGWYETRKSMSEATLRILRRTRETRGDVNHSFRVWCFNTPVKNFQTVLNVMYLCHVYNKELPDRNNSTIKITSKSAETGVPSLKRYEEEGNAWMLIRGLEHECYLKGIKPTAMQVVESFNPILESGSKVGTYSCQMRELFTKKHIAEAGTVAYDSVRKFLDSTQTIGTLTNSTSTIDKVTRTFDLKLRREMAANKKTERLIRRACSIRHRERLLPMLRKRLEETGQLADYEGFDEEMKRQLSEAKMRKERSVTRLMSSVKRMSDVKDDFSLHQSLTRLVKSVNTTERIFSQNKASRDVFISKFLGNLEGTEDSVLKKILGSEINILMAQKRDAKASALSPEVRRATSILSNTKIMDQKCADNFSRMYGQLSDEAAKCYTVGTSFLRVLCMSLVTIVIRGNNEEVEATMDRYYKSVSSVIPLSDELDELRAKSEALGKEMNDKPLHNFELRVHNLRAEYAAYWAKPDWTMVCLHIFCLLITTGSAMDVSSEDNSTLADQIIHIAAEKSMEMGNYLTATSEAIDINEKEIVEQAQEMLKVGTLQTWQVHLENWQEGLPDYNDAAGGYSELSLRDYAVEIYNGIKYGNGIENFVPSNAWNKNTTSSIIDNISALTQMSLNSTLGASMMNLCSLLKPFMNWSEGKLANQAKMSFKNYTPGKSTRTKVCLKLATKSLEKQTDLKNYDLSIQRIGEKASVSTEKVYYGVAPKEQIGADRELGIMPFEPKIMVNLVHKIITSICRSMKKTKVTETLANPGEKYEFPEDALDTLTLEYMTADSGGGPIAHMFMNKDHSKWGPVTKPESFIHNLRVYQSHLGSLANFLKCAYIKGQYKDVELPPQVVDLLSLNDDDYVEGLNVNFDYLRENCVKKGKSYYCKHTQDMIQGIFHAASSLHDCEMAGGKWALIEKLFATREMVGKLCCRLKITSAKGSDDELSLSIMKPAIGDRVTDQQWREIVPHIKRSLVVADIIFSRIYNSHVSPKSSFSEIMAEFNSMFQDPRQLCPGSKFSMAISSGHSHHDLKDAQTSIFSACQAALYQNVPLSIIALAHWAAQTDVMADSRMLAIAATGLRAYSSLGKNKIWGCQIMMPAALGGSFSPDQSNLMRTFARIELESYKLLRIRIADEKHEREFLQTYTNIRSEEDIRKHLDDLKETVEAIASLPRAESNGMMHEARQFNIRAPCFFKLDIRSPLNSATRHANEKSLMIRQSLKRALTFKTRAEKLLYTIKTELKPRDSMANLVLIDRALRSPGMRWSLADLNRNVVMRGFIALGTGAWYRPLFESQDEKVLGLKNWTLEKVLRSIKDIPRKEGAQDELERIRQLMSDSDSYTIRQLVSLENSTIVGSESRIPRNVGRQEIQITDANLGISNQPAEIVGALCMDFLGSTNGDFPDAPWGNLLLEANSVEQIVSEPIKQLKEWTSDPESTVDVNGVLTTLYSILGSYRRGKQMVFTNRPRRAWATEVVAAMTESQVIGGRKLTRAGEADVTTEAYMTRSIESVREIFTLIYYIYGETAQAVYKSIYDKLTIRTHNKAVTIRSLLTSLLETTIGRMSDKRRDILLFGAAAGHESMMKILAEESKDTLGQVFVEMREGWTILTYTALHCTTVVSTNGTTTRVESTNINFGPLEEALNHITAAWLNLGRGNTVSDITWLNTTAPNDDLIAARLEPGHQKILYIDPNGNPSSDPVDIGQRGVLIVTRNRRLWITRGRGNIYQLGKDLRITINEEGIFAKVEGAPVGDLVKAQLVEYKELASKLRLFDQDNTGFVRASLGRFINTNSRLPSQRSVVFRHTAWSRTIASKNVDTFRMVYKLRPAVNILEKMKKVEEKDIVVDEGSSWIMDEVERGLRSAKLKNDYHAKLKEAADQIYKTRKEREDKIYEQRMKSFGEEEVDEWGPERDKDGNIIEPDEPREFTPEVAEEMAIQEGKVKFDRNEVKDQVLLMLREAYRSSSRENRVGDMLKTAYTLMEMVAPGLKSRVTDIYKLEGLAESNELIWSAHELIRQNIEGSKELSWVSLLRKLSEGNSVSGYLSARQALFILITLPTQRGSSSLQFSLLLPVFTRRECVTADIPRDVARRRLFCKEPKFNFEVREIGERIFYLACAIFFPEYVSRKMEDERSELIRQEVDRRIASKAMEGSLGMELWQYKNYSCSVAESEASANYSLRDSSSGASDRGGVRLGDVAPSRTFGDCKDIEEVIALYKKARDFTGPTLDNQVIKGELEDETINFYSLMEMHASSVAAYHTLEQITHAYATHNCLDDIAETTDSKTGKNTEMSGDSQSRRPGSFNNEDEDELDVYEGEGLEDEGQTMSDISDDDSWGRKYKETGSLISDGSKDPGFAQDWADDFSDEEEDENEEQMNEAAALMGEDSEDLGPDVRRKVRKETEREARERITNEVSSERGEISEEAILAQLEIDKAMAIRLMERFAVIGPACAVRNISEYVPILYMPSGIVQDLNMLTSCQMSITRISKTDFVWEKIAGVLDEIYWKQIRTIYGANREMRNTKVKAGWLSQGGGIGSAWVHVQDTKAFRHLFKVLVMDEIFRSDE